ncbi:MAG: hypothetical protein GXO25_02910 [Euryarchaeota archaeon]|nr:hypothetical protein [Euryarchaeota archaeon]
MKIQIDGEILDKRTPIKIKITDDAIYFMSESGKIKEIRLENIELVMLNKTLFGNGAIVKIIERISGNKVKHHYFYLDEELGKVIRDAHSKYVDYGFKGDNR